MATTSRTTGCGSSARAATRRWPRRPRSRSRCGCCAGCPPAEVARSFLVSEADDGRADHPGQEEDRQPRGIPYRVPAAAELPARIDGGARGGAPAVHDRAHRAGGRRPAPRRPRRALAATSPGCCARCCPTDAAGGRPARADPAHRRPRRRDPHRRRRRAGAARRSGPLGLGPRPRSPRGSRWSAEALRARPPSRFALQAAIAAVHAEAPSWAATDWAEIVGLYDVLLAPWPSPVVALNRAVAVGFAAGPGGRAGRTGRAGRRAAAGRLRLPRRGARRLPAPPRSSRRGPDGVRRGVAPDRERGGTPIPDRPPCHTGAVIDVAPMPPPTGHGSGRSTLRALPPAMRRSSPRRRSGDAWNARASARPPLRRAYGRADLRLGRGDAGVRPPRVRRRRRAQRVRRSGCGRSRRRPALLATLIASDRGGRDLDDLTSGIFPENAASLTLHERLGFRRVGVRERIGCHRGVWRDVVLVERRSRVTGRS